LSKETYVSLDGTWGLDDTDHGCHGHGGARRGPHRRILRDLNLSVPEPRVDERMTPAYATLVITHAPRITANLGGQPPGAWTA
jgi:hypothetical protein